MYRHRRHASQRRRTSAVQSGLAVKLAIGKVIACWQHLFIGKPTRNRILHQLELDACSTGFSRNRILPAKAFNYQRAGSLMQNPSKRGRSGKWLWPRLRVGFPLRLFCQAYGCWLNRYIQPAPAYEQITALESKATMNKMRPLRVTSRFAG